jgi:hypothetical protein
MDGKDLYAAMCHAAIENRSDRDKLGHDDTYALELCIAPPFMPRPPPNLLECDVAVWHLGLTRDAYAKQGVGCGFLLLAYCYIC